MPTESSSSAPPVPHSDHETSIVDTLQSLIIAFVLAMTFRGFVTEGFVIPTGSMAPTLMGAHLLLHSDQSGVTFPVGLDQWVDRLKTPGGPAELKQAIDQRSVDPMLGPKYHQSGPHDAILRQRMGDRILVLKCLYPFAQPRRFDVVVFKNPTDPIGEAGNYIKRLIGLPDEQVWLADGDVFSKPAGSDEFDIRRKPEHVQRAVWQRIFDSDDPPINPQRLESRVNEGPPWNGEGWQTTLRDDQGILRWLRAYRCNSAAPTMMRWRNELRVIDDWTSYNMLAFGASPVAVSDVRVSAAIVPDAAGFSTALKLVTRRHEFEFQLTGATATVRMRPQGTDTQWTLVNEASIELPSPGRVFDVEFWHVDQSMSIFLDGRRVAHMNYDWSPLQRLQEAGGDPATTNIDDLLARQAPPPRLEWRFEGSPVTLYRVRLDRDLHYRQGNVGDSRQQNGPRLFGPAFGTNPTTTFQLGDGRTLQSGTLGPDQFMMCGDNSQMSLDSRLWGRPHPLITTQIGDDTPFVVNRELLLGKAWVVYFPATFSIKEDGGLPVVPDFGRLRFIR
jgi:signal peptidase I